MAQKKFFITSSGVLIVWLLAGMVQTASAAVDFEPAVNYAVPNLNPNWVAVGDFNNDGKLDLATANFPPDSSGSASVLMGNGNGTFGPATTYPTASGSISAVVGDFNGDGKLDLATANYGGNNVSVLLGNGDGTFLAVTNLPVGRFTGGSSWPYSVAVGDFNRDGKLDLATANNGSSDLSVLLGNGDGTFDAATNFPVSRPFRVAVGDFNGDGRLDLVTANWDTPGVSVLLGNDDGSFGVATNFSVGLSYRSVVADDFNRDGKLDLATANFSGKSVGVLLGIGNGTFAASTYFSIGGSPESLTVGEIDGDGKLDLVSANRSGSSVSVLLGNGEGTFGAATNFSVGLSPRSVAVGDFNRDGKPDLVTANNGSNNVSVLLSGDNTAPVISCGSPDGLWHASDVSIACTAQDADVGLADPADANFLLTTSVPGGTETSNAATGTRTVCDRNGNCRTAGPISGNKVDKKAPSASCGSADDQWHSANLSVACTASDGGSGLASASDASFSLLTNIPSGAESANAGGVPRNVCDAVSNCTPATVPAGTKVDRKAPSITIITPQATRYLPRQTVVASYSCTDGGSGVALCVGPVPSGSSMDTAPPGGSRTFTVFAADKTGNVSSQTVTYEVRGPEAPKP